MYMISNARRVDLKAQKPLEIREAKLFKEKLLLYHDHWLLLTEVFSTGCGAASIWFLMGR